MFGKSAKRLPKHMFKVGFEPTGLDWQSDALASKPLEQTEIVALNVTSVYVQLPATPRTVKSDRQVALAARISRKRTKSVSLCLRQFSLVLMAG